MKAIVFGAGKIARGFIGHLLYLNHVHTVFVDVNPSVVALLNNRQTYQVHVMGNPEKSGAIGNFHAITLDDIESIARYWSKADIAFISVGGKNLPALAKVLAQAFEIRSSRWGINQPVNMITCENWHQPAAMLRSEIRNHLSMDVQPIFDHWAGIAESVVLRSGVEPTQEMLQQDPLCVRVSNHWELPVDGQSLKGKPPRLEGITYLNDFSGFLERKFYTYNAANATVSYLGYLKGHVLLYDAATDPEIVEILEGVYMETSQAIVRKYGILIVEQEAFARSSRNKLQDPAITDYVERNARDPIRKLGPQDRLIGPARLVQAWYGNPEFLALTIAAALYYDHPDDPSAIKLRELREEKGEEYILQSICQLDGEDRLHQLILEKVHALRNKGWIS
jgi:mannitol-1-phosphate 5-dehydrogenase